MSTRVPPQLVESGPDVQIPAKKRDEFWGQEETKWVDNPGHVYHYYPIYNPGQATQLRKRGVRAETRAVGTSDDGKRTIYSMYVHYVGPEDAEAVKADVKARGEALKSRLAGKSQEKEEAAKPNPQVTTPGPSVRSRFQ